MNINDNVNIEVLGDVNILSNVVTDVDLLDYALTSQIPISVSQLENDSGYTTNIGTVTSVIMNNEAFAPDDDGNVDLGTVIREHQSIDYLYQKLSLSSYALKEDLSLYALKSDIPTSTSQLENDSGFVSSDSRLDNVGKAIFSGRYTDETTFSICVLSCMNDDE